MLTPSCCHLLPVCISVSSSSQEHIRKALYNRELQLTFPSWLQVPQDFLGSNCLPAGLHDMCIETALLCKTCLQWVQCMYKQLTSVYARV